MATTSATAHRARRLVRAITSGLAVALLVTLIAFLVREKFDPLVRLDEGAIRTATSYTRERPALRSALLVWQEITQPIHLYIVMTAVCLWVWLARRRTTLAWWAFVTMMLGWNLALVLKYVVQRARPVVDDPVSHSPGYSFPSGHAANAAIVATVVVLLCWPLLRRGGRVILLVVAATFVLSVCLDRVFLGVHYPSDVTAGVLLGCGLVLASWLGLLGWQPPDHPLHDSLHPHRKEAP